MGVAQSWPEYVQRIAGGLTHAQIAARSGVSVSNVGRWLRGELTSPDAGNVIAFAKAFDRPPLEALTAAGYFTEDEVIPEARTPLSDYAIPELLDELRRRTVTD
jgi:transcriptional regulator with XRE-family HTH domain